MGTQKRTPIESLIQPLQGCVSLHPFSAFSSFHSRVRVPGECAPGAVGGAAIALRLRGGHTLVPTPIGKLCAGPGIQGSRGRLFGREVWMLISWRPSTAPKSPFLPGWRFLCSESQMEVGLPKSSRGSLGPQSRRASCSQHLPGSAVGLTGCLAGDVRFTLSPPADTWVMQAGP